jgi:hypothetical protein
MEFQLLADENTAHHFISACVRLDPQFPIIHISDWKGGAWLGLDDQLLLLSAASEQLVLVSFDRATLAWHAGQLARAGEDYSGLILFRGLVRSTDYGFQAKLVTTFWREQGSSSDWQNRTIYLPKSP